MIRSVSVLAVAAAGCVLAGCTSSGSGTSTSSPAPSPSRTTASRTSSPPPVQHSLPAATAIVNVPNERKNVTLDACTANASGWQASGTAVNTRAKAVRYSITVFFTDSAATVLNYGAVTVRVPAGKTEKWVAASKFEKTANVRCVLRGVGTT